LLTCQNAALPLPEAPGRLNGLLVFAHTGLRAEGQVSGTEVRISARLALGMAPVVPPDQLFVKRSMRLPLAALSTDPLHGFSLPGSQTAPGKVVWITALRRLMSTGYN
jgi:hypothetical protein